MRQTFTATVEVTVEDAPTDYSNAQLADDIRDMVFSVISEETELDAVVKEVYGNPKSSAASVQIETDTDAPDIAWVRYGDVSVAVTESSEGLVISVENMPHAARPAKVSLSSPEKTLWEGVLA
jgi:hypothetical protein